MNVGYPYYRVGKQYKASREYKAYSNAKQRCLNSNNPAYEQYGGRGIEFRYTDFQQLYTELGPCPTDYSLDRIDNDGHYEKGNVRWASRIQQHANSRRPVIKPTIPFCHPTRKHHSLGMCQNCYAKVKYRRDRFKPAFKKRTAAKARKRWQAIKADPVRYAAWSAKHKEWKNARIKKSASSQPSADGGQLSRQA